MSQAKLTKLHDIVCNDESGDVYEFALGHLDVAGFNAAREANSPTFHESNDPLDGSEELCHWWAVTDGEVYGDDMVIIFHEDEQPDSQPVTVIPP